jgi:DNA polymerase III subunit epsilon
MNCGNFIVLDYETGGLNEEKNPITEVGLYSFRADTFEEISRFQTYVKPYDNTLLYEEEALKYTGITMSQINSGMPLDQVITRIIEEFEKAKCGNKGKQSKPYLIGHNFYDFDKRFLEATFKRCKKDPWKFVNIYIYDTLPMSRMRWPNVEGLKFNLEACCERAGVELVDGHGALNDVIGNAGLFKYLIKAMRSEEGGYSEAVKEKRFRDTFQFEY